VTDREVLFQYRLREAHETLLDARKMTDAGVEPRSIVNRAYYALFYAVLALCLRFEIPLKTSKHTGVVGAFDREFVQAGRADVRLSKILHRLFELRQRSDYRELTVVAPEEAATAVAEAEEFLAAVERLIG
jgi:uncharacterized protein (UPF0332 family)